MEMTRAAVREPTDIDAAIAEIAAQPGGGLVVMVDAFNIMQDRITRARLAGDPPDVLVSPRIGEIGWFDFHRAKQAIDIGATAAERALDPISEAITALSAYPASVTPIIKK